MKKIAVGIGVGLLFFVLSQPFFAMSHALVIGIIAFLVTLWTNEGLPLGVVSMLPILLFPVFGILSTSEVTANYSKSIIFLFLGGFMLAIAIEKRKDPTAQIFFCEIVELFPKDSYRDYLCTGSHFGTAEFHSIQYDHYADADAYCAVFK